MRKGGWAELRAVAASELFVVVIYLQSLAFLVISLVTCFGVIV